MKRGLVVFGLAVLSQLFPLNVMASTGTLKIELGGEPFQKLDISKVTFLTGGQQQEVSSDEEEHSRYLKFDLPPGFHKLRLVALGKVSFVRDYGPFEVISGKETKASIRLEDSLSSIKLKIPEGIRDPEVWLFADKGDSRPVARILAPLDGVIDHVATGSMWMVITDRDQNIVARQWISVESGSPNLIQVKRTKIPRYFPLTVFVRADKRDIAVGQVTVSSAKGQSDLQRNGRMFVGQVDPGESSIHAKSGRHDLSQRAYFGFDRLTNTFLLRIKSELDHYWCDTAHMEQAAEWFNEGKRLEAESRWFDALMFYRLADFCLKDDSAIEKVKIVGQKMSALARKQGQLFNSGKRLYVRIPGSRDCGNMPRALASDGVCLGAYAVKSNPNGGAIEWLVASHNDRLAWQEIARYIGGADSMWGVKGSRELRYWAAEKSGLQPSSEVVLPIESKILDKEDAAFAYARSGRIGISGDEFETGSEASLAWLEEARQWVLIADMNMARIRGRAEKRADALLGMKHPRPELLEMAKEYFDLIGESKGLEKVKSRASMLGYQAMEQGLLEQANHYFNIAEDEQGMARLSTLKHQQEAHEKARMEKRKKTFMDEIKSLEEELGF